MNFKNLFNDVTMIDRQDDFLTFKISNEGILLSELFGKLEDHKVEYNIIEYNFSQTTLEQVK